jgi:hypothetical protein
LQAQSVTLEERTINQLLKFNKQKKDGVQEETALRTENKRDEENLLSHFLKTSVCVAQGLCE